MRIDWGSKLIFGPNLKKARELRGWSRKQLGQAMNLFTHDITLFERCERQPSVSRLLEFSHALEISTDALLGLNDEELDMFDDSKYICYIAKHNDDQMTIK